MMPMPLRNPYGRPMVETVEARVLLSGDVAPLVETPDVTPPTAALQAPRLRRPGAETYTFTVTYSDDGKVVPGTMDDQDLLVAGPGGYSSGATLVGVNRYRSGTHRTATYSVPAPTGQGWRRADNGVYTVTLREGQVGDTSGNFAQAATLGAFTVRIPKVAGSAAGVRQVAEIQAREIDESSGLVASRQYRGVFYTHNDGGDATLYAIGADGGLVGRFALDVETEDWEDVAADDAGHLYVADSGDNDANRGSIQVRRVAEPDVAVGGTVDEGTLAVDRTWNLRFPGGAVDCESLVVVGGQGYVITKRRDGGPAEVYRFPLKASKRERVLERVATLGIRTPVTGADVSADGGRLAVVSEGGLYLYAIDGDVSAAGRVTPSVLAVPGTQIEAVAFRRDGGLLLTAESREVYEVGAG
jgi:hypothetical protein